MSSSKAELLAAVQAAERLGVSPATLYAYVSRGKIRSLPGPGRTRLYPAEDVERLRAAAESEAGHRSVVRGPFSWAQPVLGTELVEVTSEGPRYRGVPALELAARGVPFESVAELLWSGELPSDVPCWRERRLTRVRLSGLPRARTPLALMSLWLPVLALGDPGRFLLSERSDLVRARRIILALVEQLAARRGARSARRARRASSVSQALLLALGGRSERRTCAAVDRALVLVADHELNPSTFAARVAASTGADLYSCLAAALATLSGPRHGGTTDRIEALLSEVETPRRARSVVVSRCRRGETIPGFGHSRYPAGDPRARPLVEVAERTSERVEMRTLSAVRRAMERAGQPAPTIDFGLVCVCAALGLPKGSAAALFAVGRMSGWVAHVLEQRRQGIVLSARARYAKQSQGPGP